MANDLGKLEVRYCTRRGQHPVDDVLFQGPVEFGKGHTDGIGAPEGEGPAHGRRGRTHLHRLQVPQPQDVLLDRMELPRPAAQKPQNLVILEIVCDVLIVEVISDLRRVERIIEEEREVEGRRCGGKATLSCTSERRRRYPQSRTLPNRQVEWRPPGCRRERPLSSSSPPCFSTFWAKRDEFFRRWMCMTGMKWASFKSTVSAQPVTAVTREITTERKTGALLFPMTRLPPHLIRYWPSLLPIGNAGLLNMKVSERNVGGAFQQCITFGLGSVGCIGAINASACIYKNKKSLDC